MDRGAGMKGELLFLDQDFLNRIRSSVSNLPPTFDPKFDLMREIQPLGIKRDAKYLLDEIRINLGIILLDRLEGRDFDLKLVESLNRLRYEVYFAGLHPNKILPSINEFSSVYEILEGRDQVQKLLYKLDK